MIALAIIWIIAALCGLAAAAVWEPALALVVSIANVVDPSFAALVRDVASIGAGADTAIGWIVALLIGVPLTLVWLALRVLAGLLRTPSRDETRGEARNAHRGEPTHRPAERGSQPLGSTVDVTPSAAHEGRQTARPTAASPEPAAAPALPREPSRDGRDAPRWGRQ